ncbi:MAG TPA: hypothetical protein ENK18_09735 [Deltaproteobacteria bacterium]|nr:hypothetical protein [Deltaproteobacteria bacterium]
MRPATLSSLILVACSGSDGAPQVLLDTGWFEGSTQTGACTDVFVASEPAGGETDWYWRDLPRAFTQTDRVNRYNAWLQDADGNLIETQMAWADGNLSFELASERSLEANTDYVLVLQDCQQTQEIPFTTSPLGTPLSEPAASLVGNTYLLDLAGAEWIEPPQLASIIAVYLTDPILLGVRFADADQIDFLGAPGSTDTLGQVSQAQGVPTWNFPLSDFSQQPFIDAQAEQITLQYSLDEVIDIPVQDFVLQATFSADGRSIGGGILSGRADTREIGLLLNPNDEGALCELSAGLGVFCEPCSDGQSYCLDLVARDLEGTLQPGLVLVER